MTFTLGVVVPARNAGDTIGATLAAIGSISGTHVDVVVVDGESVDNTVRIATAMGARVTSRQPQC